MSLAEHRELLASAARAVGKDGRNPQAEIGLRRRRIALLEWLLAEELNDPRMAGDFDENALRSLLQAARRQLAGP
jgi:hypothetical protein